jgi:membrane-bound lytic murein transglycosylase B
VSLRVVVSVAVAGAALWALTATAACIVLLLLSLVPYPRGANAGGGLASPSVSPYTPSAAALADIPPSYLTLYRSAAARFGLDWTILAGIGKVECDHGRDPDPSCTDEGHLNYAGAGGPAQFLLSTWKEYGISASGSSPPDMWNPADAVYSMANYLHAVGAPGDYPRAVYAYNHAWWYVAEVMAWARRYRARYGATTGLAHAARAGPQAAALGRPGAA